jgi:hypothetical protein
MSEAAAGAKEAGVMCFYLCGRPATPELASRYCDALAIKGIPLLERIKPLQLQLGRKYSDRLTVMAALLETDPAYNQMFRNSQSLLLSWLSTILHMVAGALKALAGRILFIR